MAIWKHYIVLFGGFYDPGITSECIVFLDDFGVVVERLMDMRRHSSIFERSLVIRHARV